MEKLEPQNSFDQALNDAYDIYAQTLGHHNSVKVYKHSGNWLWLSEHILKANKKKNNHLSSTVYKRTF